MAEILRETFPQLNSIQLIFLSSQHAVSQSASESLFVVHYILNHIQIEERKQKKKLNGKIH